MLYFPVGGMWLPASGFQKETPAGSRVSPVGPGVCVTSWCRLRGSSTLKDGPSGLATCTTGQNCTTGAYTHTHSDSDTWWHFVLFTPLGNIWFEQFVLNVCFAFFNWDIHMINWIELNGIMTEQHTLGTLCIVMLEIYVFLESLASELEPH